MVLTDEAGNMPHAEDLMRTVVQPVAIAFSPEPRKGSEEWPGWYT